MKYIKQTFLVILLTLMSIRSFAQTFYEYLGDLSELKCPVSFDKAGQVDYPDLALPAHLFENSVFNLSKQLAFAKIMLDENYPIILIGHMSDRGDHFHSITAYSFDTNGNYVSRILLSHDDVGSGSEYSITPENKIRIASYGASDAVINTYRYENGEFIKEEGREYADADNLPDY